MGLRPLLVGLIVVATALFVMGAAIERGSGSEAHHEVAAPASSGEQEHGDEAGREAKSSHEGEESGAQGGESGERTEVRPLGVDIEAWPFVILAALASVALAAAAWLRPGVRGLLAVVAVAMFVFAALDIREVAHQLDVDEGGLAVLAGVIAALHLAAGAVAALMASRAGLGHDGSPSRTGTVPA